MRATKADALKSIKTQLQKELDTEERILDLIDELRVALEGDSRFFVLQIDGCLRVMEKNKAYVLLFDSPSRPKQATIFYSLSPECLRPGNIEDVLLQYAELAKPADGVTFIELMAQLRQMQENHSSLEEHHDLLLKSARKELEADGRFIVFCYRGDKTQHIVLKSDFCLVVCSNSREVVEVDVIKSSRRWSEELLLKYWSLLDNDGNLLSQNSCLQKEKEEQHVGFGNGSGFGGSDEGFGSCAGFGGSDEGFGSANRGNGYPRRRRCP
jgi:hypothetical protein